MEQWETTVEMYILLNISEILRRIQASPPLHLKSWREPSPKSPPLHSRSSNAETNSSVY